MVILEVQDDILVCIDKEVLKRKYQEECNKWLWSDGNDQYIEIKDQFFYYFEDFYMLFVE